MRRIMIYACLIIVVLLGGCVPGRTPKPVLPESLNGQGLVVAEIVSFEGDVTNNTVAYHEIKISGFHKGRLSRNHMGMVLSPGEYELESLLGSTGRGEITRPIKRKFSIKANEVTNLGLILLIANTDDVIAKKRYFIVNVDNTDDIKFYLQKFYPKFVATLSPEAIKLAPGNYAEGEKLEKVRFHILNEMSKNSKSRANFIVGLGGAVAKLDREASGKITGYKIIPIPTRSGASLTAEHSANNRFAFTTTDRLFVLESDEFVPVTLPTNGEEKALFLGREHDIILIDKNFKIFLSHDDGQAWQVNSDHMVESEDYTRFGLFEDKSGYFLFNSSPAKIIKIEHGSDKGEPISLPKEVSSISNFSATEKEFFLETTHIIWTKNTPNPFYVRSRDSDEWQTRFMPNTLCTTIEFLDEQGQNLQTVCGYRNTFISSNGGKSWSFKSMDP